MSNHKLHVPNALDAHMQDVVLRFGIAGIVLPASLLLAIAYAAWNPITRHHLNRVSFRLLVCALIANLIFAASSIPTFSSPSPECSFMAFFGLSILMFSACMFFCTALNLQLVLVHHLNGNSLEKFYYIGSIAVVAILNIPPYVAGQFGYYNNTCWFSDAHPDVRFRWLLGSQSIWILLMSTGEVISFLMILGYMYRASRIPAPPKGDVKSLDLVVHAADRDVPDYHSSNRFALSLYNVWLVFNTALGLYPLLSCCLSFTGSILDIWLTKNPVPTELQWRLSLVNLCAFSLRPILYTLLAAADPGYIRAMCALRPHCKSTGSTCSRKYTNSHSVKWFSMKSSEPVHAELEQSKYSTTGGTGKDKLRVEQSMGMEPEQSGLSEGERGTAEELDVEAQTCSTAEDIMRQI
ncbi:hypothetical protein B0H11DRAFT_2375213 [Mycena galericulata]|nr:hypothetical protein B0H11DRAFT_2375213 [Mycena galericulata]